MTDSIRARVIAAGRAIGLYAAGGLAAPVVGFFALPVFTRIFDPEEFGVIGLFTAAVGLLTPVLSLGGYVFILYDRRSAPEKVGVSEAVVLISAAGASLGVTGLLVAFATGSLDGESWWLFTLALLTAWANVWVMVRLHRFQASQLPGRFFLLSAVPPVLAFALTLSLAVSVDGWASRIIALALTAALAASWAGFSLAREGRLAFGAGRKQLRRVARFGAPLVVHTASIWVVGFTDRFIIAEIEGLAAAGIYTVAYAISLGVSSAHDGVARYFASRLPEWSASQSGRRAASRFSYTYALLGVLTIPVLIPLALIGMKLLVSDAFADGSDLLMWLIPAQSFAGIARVFSGYLYVEQRTRHRAALSAFEAILNLALTLFLVSAYGVVGAAAATLVTYAFSMIGTFLLARSGETLMRLGAARRLPPQ